jgi:hypothetical protein
LTYPRNGSSITAIEAVTTIKKLYNIDTRKDITQQDLKDPVTVELVEKCARFHIVCAERLIEEVRYRFENTYLK